MNGELLLAKKESEKESYEEISNWLDIYHTSDNEKERDVAKARIVKKMIPVVKRVAKTIARRAYDPVDDLVQAGFIGLLKAIEKYSKEKNDNFRVYAGYFIIGEIKHYLRDKMNVVRIPRHIQELIIRINNFTKTLTPEELKLITSEEVAYELDTSPDSVNLAIEVDRRKSTLYLDDVYSGTEMLGYEEVLPEEEFEKKLAYEEAKIIFNDIIEKLPPDERVIIDMYYKQDMNKREIAQALLVSPMSVTRRMKQAFNIISSIIVDDSVKKELLKEDFKIKEKSESK